MASARDIPDTTASEGVMGSAQPGRAQRGDIEFGWPLLTQIVELEIGRSLAVRERDVIAVEAAEGTEALIERAGSLCRSRGWTLLLTAKANRPSGAPGVGIETIDRLARAGAGCVALGAGRIVLIDKPAVLAAADRAKIAVVGVGEASAAPASP
ncbi:MAG: UDP-2,3-diacylglucosamine diphosphatase LpxI domain-containing protein [Planctomycetota bacterium]|jgi:DUF1009 family protein